MPRKKQVVHQKEKDIEQYKHKDKTRLNNPQVGMVNESNDPEDGQKKYTYDPHLDPTLVWAGKKEQSELDVDKQHVTRSTNDMPTWFTRRESEPINKSHISHMVGDGSWEMAVARTLDSNEGIGKFVDAWVKNDHLNFEIPYVWGGTVRHYIPDFLIKLNNGKILVLEVKGVDTPQNQRKRKFLDEWVKTVNTDGRFGKWAWDVVFQPNELDNTLLKHTE